MIFTSKKTEPAHWAAHTGMMHSLYSAKTTGLEKRQTQDRMLQEEAQGTKQSLAMGENNGFFPDTRAARIKIGLPGVSGSDETVSEKVNF